MFDIVDVSAWTVASEEVLGSKEKDWLRRDPSSEELWLFKATRTDTNDGRSTHAGDDWAEKIVAELAELLGLPHAVTELACRDGRPGIISRDFRRSQSGERGRFVPGNELLWRRNPEYPRGNRRVPLHTVSGVFDVLKAIGAAVPASPIALPADSDAASVFSGYLILDAWVGNQDRHHENWGVVVWDGLAPPRSPMLAPSFDHASSLGQNETDERRNMRLTTRDKRATVEAWSSKATCPFFRAATDRKPLSTMDAAAIAFQKYPAACRSWTGRLGDVEQSGIQQILGRVPVDLMSEPARHVALRMLQSNRDLLLRHLVS